MFNVEIIRSTALVCMILFTLLMIIKNETKILLITKLKFNLDLSYIIEYFKIILLSVSIIILLYKGHINMPLIKNLLHIELYGLCIAIFTRITLIFLCIISKNNKIILFLFCLTSLKPVIIIGSLIAANCIIN